MILKNTLIVSIVTLFSRIFGYIRDVILAAQLGAGIYNDIFIIAFRIPNLFRTIFGEGAFNSSFIPIYAGILETQGKKQAAIFASYIQTILILLLLFFCLIFFIFLPRIINFIAPGITEIDFISLATALSRITITYLLCISLVAFYGGILNSNGKYFAYAAAPIILNITLIFSSFFGINKIDKVFALSWGVFIAGFLELIWIFIFLYKTSNMINFMIPKITVDVKNLLKRILPGLLGSGVVQVNIFIDTVIASFIPSALSYIYYADRINQLPLALIATTMSIVMLPVLTKAYRRGDVEVGLRLQNQAVNLIFLVLLPCAYIIATFSLEIVSILFERSRFNSIATQETAKTLCALCFGLPAYALIKVAVTNFHAHGNTKTPVTIACICVASNIILSLTLVDKFKYIGIALASSISAWLNISLLWWRLNRERRFKFSVELINRIVIYILATLFMALSLEISRYLLGYKNSYILIFYMLIISLLTYIMPLYFCNIISFKKIKQSISLRDNKYES